MSGIATCVPVSDTQSLHSLRRKPFSAKPIAIGMRVAPAAPAHLRSTHMRRVARRRSGYGRDQVSRDARLTLVVDRTDVVTRYVRSPRVLIDDAIEDLATREGAPKNRIGFVDLRADRSSATSVISHAQTCATVRAWAEVRGFNGVVWTALASNFRDETGDDFLGRNCDRLSTGAAPKRPLRRTSLHPKCS
jgi:hypothetical protein